MAQKRIQINNEGRVTIPADIRADLGVKAFDMLIIEAADGIATITPEKAKCCICGKTPEAAPLTFYGKVFCTNCETELKQHLKEIKENG